MAVTPNFSWPTPDDSDQLSSGAAAIRTLGSAIDERVYLESVQRGMSTAVSDAIALDFSDANAFVTRSVSGTAIVITASGYGGGRAKTVRIVGGTAIASLSTPAEWTFVGNAAGTSIGTATTALITAQAFGTSASDVIARYEESS